jgi:hypothetical protein
MADYMDVTEVEATLPKGVKIDDSSTDSPTRATVVVMCGNVTKQIDDAYAKGGGTPQLTGNAAGNAKLRGTREVCYQILVQRGMSVDKDMEPQWIKWHEEFETFLGVLSGTEATSATAVSGPPRRGADVDPWFTRDQVF